MLLVPAGPIVDNVIRDLLPLLEKGDLIIDGGNSKFTDTERRATALEAQGLHFFGMGISGGAEGARLGPSMMPGGDQEAYTHVTKMFDDISAHVDGEPCVAYIGPGASGHFVKMVHNGIEYALMQLIAETYDLVRNGVGLENEAIHALFKKWNDGRLHSFLLEITADIFTVRSPDSPNFLLDEIKDAAKSKGTGKWTSQFAMDLQAPVPSIDAAVSTRDLSKYKSLRTELAQLYPGDTRHGTLAGNAVAYLETLERAFYFSMISIYAQGMQMLSHASAEYQYNLNLGQIARIWRGGCIIRSRFLDQIYGAYHQNPALAHLFLDPQIQSLITESIADARTILSGVIASGFSVPVYSASLNYFEAMRTERMPTNLSQAQRDYFGAHTYELVGKEGVFHHNWTESK
jgi:6-phosphogluconate dehydrogenase